MDKFLVVSYGSGYGYGYGYGSGSGYVDGSGYGYGDGSGYGSGDGSGYGSGYGYGDGYGDGSGDGSGEGYGSGSGYGYGDGSGYGYGSGSGYGDGSGYDNSGIQYYCGQEVHLIDDIPTTLLKVRGNIAEGYIINKDLTTKPCFVVKNDKYFAHGDSVKLAYAALQDKVIANMSFEEKRVAEFNTKFTSDTDKYAAIDLFDWHGKLTGSCKSGRETFIYNKGIDLSTTEFSIPEFIAMTINEYGGAVIKVLKDSRG